MDVTSENSLHYRYRVNLLCPRCGAKGSAEVSQHGDHFTNKLRFNVDRVSRGFYVANATNAPATTEICCSLCGEVAQVWREG